MLANEQFAFFDGDAPVAAARLTVHESVRDIPHAEIQDHAFLNEPPLPVKVELAKGTQAGNLPLLQSAAVGGQWMVGLLIAWTAAVANEVWERRAIAGAGRTLLVFGTVLGAVLALGGVQYEAAEQIEQVVRSEVLAAQQGGRA